MPEQLSPQQQLQQAIEKDVRFLIGDLQMQVIILRNMMDMSQTAQQAPPPEPPMREKMNGGPNLREVNP